MANQTEEFIQFSIRVPKILNEKLQEDAETFKRSRNNQVAYILENYYESKEKQMHTALEPAEQPA